MKNLMKKIVREGLGKAGDKMNNSVCFSVLYQPKACKRGKSQTKEVK